LFLPNKIHVFPRNFIFGLCINQLEAMKSLLIPVFLLTGHLKADVTDTEKGVDKFDRKALGSQFSAWNIFKIFSAVGLIIDIKPIKL
jgi:uncharacterized membrane protein YoaK (UPF0700 family)